MAVTVLDVAQLIGARMQGGTAEQAQSPITEVGLNSAELPAGALFAAVPGTRVHGARFAADTAAAAILTDEAGWGLLSAAGETRPVLVVDDVRPVGGVGINGAAAADTGVTDSVIGCHFEVSFLLVLVASFSIARTRTGAARELSAISAGVAFSAPRVTSRNLAAYSGSSMGSPRGVLEVVISVKYFLMILSSRDW